MMPLIFSVIGVLALLLIIRLAIGHYRAGGNLDELALQLRPMDVEAFRNLIDEREQDFLRERLTRGEFRSVNRERMLAAVEYVWCATQNAGILIRLAEAAKQDKDPATAAAAEKLLGSAVRLRLYAFRVIPRLYLAVLLPRPGSGPIFVADTYDNMNRQFVLLGCMQYSAHAISTAV
jgi:hypothetical protein